MLAAAAAQKRCETRLYDPLEFFCSRVELTSVPGGQNAMAHLKKRKLEAESAAKQQHQQPKQQQLALNSGSKKSAGAGGGVQQQQQQVNDMQDCTADNTLTKRRRKSVRDDHKSSTTADSNANTDANKNISLPQKKRVFPSSQQSSSSPARKTGKNNSEEPEDDETLIRETEAALKSLSGSWVPGPNRSSFYQRGNSDEDRYESNFENLFEEKKDGSKMSPSSMSQSSTASNETGCSLKDVVTLRGQQERKFNQSQKSSVDLYKQYNGGKARKEEHDVNSMINQDDRRHSRLSAYKNDRARYGGQPEFADESSNELEIDMSEPAAGDRNQDLADKTRNSTESSPKQQQQHHLYGSGYQRPPYGDGLKSPVGSSFSVASAFRPPNTDHSKNNNNNSSSANNNNNNGGCRNVGSIPPMGPYPAAATFVGYPSPGPTMPVPQPVPGISSPPHVDDKHSSSVSLLQLKSPKEEPQQAQPPTTAPPRNDTGGVTKQIGSPDSKQYTILQPAGAGSRAASAIQDIAREGVVSVAAVTSNATPAACNGTTTTNAKPTTTTTTSPSGDSTNLQDSIKINDRLGGGFEPNRPGMSMSPGSLSRGKSSIFMYRM